MCRAKRGGLRTSSKTADANLDFAFVKTHFFWLPLDHHPFSPPLVPSSSSELLFERRFLIEIKQVSFDRVKLSAWPDLLDFLLDKKFARILGLTAGSRRCI